MARQCYAREAELADAAGLAGRLRQADLNEIKAASGKPPEAALIHGYLISDWTLAICAEDGEVIALCGVLGLPTPGAGAPWMLGSDRISEVKTTFLKNSQGIVELMHKSYPLLTNAVDVRNIVHIRWLEWLGFNFTRCVALGEHSFIQFVRCHYV